MIKKTLLNLSLIIGLMSSGTCWLLANPVKIHRKSLALEIENKRKKAEEKKRQEQAIEYRKLEDEKRKTKNYNRLLAYQQQITKMKDLYLYMWDDTCYVSGINKNINEMTEAEIDRLAANKGCGHIAKEIRYAKKCLATEIENCKPATWSQKAYTMSKNATMLPFRQNQSMMLSKMPHMANFAMENPVISFISSTKTENWLWLLLSVPVHRYLTSFIYPKSGL